MTIPTKLKQRLNQNRELTPVTIRMHEDVVESLKQIAPLRGFSGYQALLKFYVGQGYERTKKNTFLAKNNSF